MIREGAMMEFDCEGQSAVQLRSIPLLICCHLVGLVFFCALVRCNIHYS